MQLTVLRRRWVYSRKYKMYSLRIKEFENWRRIRAFSNCRAALQEIFISVCLLNWTSLCEPFWVFGESVNRGWHFFTDELATRIHSLNWAISVVLSVEARSWTSTILQVQYLQRHNGPIPDHSPTSPEITPFIFSSKWKIPGSWRCCGGLLSPFGRATYRGIACPCLVWPSTAMPAAIADQCWFLTWEWRCRISWHYGSGGSIKQSPAPENISSTGLFE